MKSVILTVMVCFIAMNINIAQTTGVDAWGNECFCDTPSSYGYTYRPVSKKTDCDFTPESTHVVNITERWYYLRLGIVSIDNMTGFPVGTYWQPVPLNTDLDPNKYAQIYTRKTMNLEEVLAWKQQFEKLGYCPTIITEYREQYMFVAD